MTLLALGIDTGGVSVEFLVDIAAMRGRKNP